MLNLSQSDSGFRQSVLDLCVSKKLMPNEYQTAFQNSYFYNKILHVLGRHDGPIFNHVAFRKF